MQKTKIEIINETIEYYSADPNGRRGYSKIEISCVYLSEDGKMCAVGRCCIDPKIEWFGDVYMLDDKYSGIDSLLKEEYRGHGIDFWKDLQLLHDNRDNWDDNGLSDDGKEFMNKLLVKYDKI